MRTAPIRIVPGGLGVDNFHTETDGVFQPTVQIGDAIVVAGSKEGARFKELQNVDLSAAQEISLRTGYTPLLTTTNVQGVFAIHDSLYYQTSGLFYKHAVTPLLLVNGLTRRATVIPTHRGFLLTDGTTHKEVVSDVVYPWGQAVPTFSLAAVSGSLPAGRYLVQLTYNDAQGNEGPASNISSITLTGTQAIRLTATIPTGSVSANVYLSGVEQSYPNFLVSVTQGQLPYVISTASVAVTDVVKTAQMAGPVAGAVGGTAFRSFILLWRDNVVFRSEAFEPHLFHPDNIMQFPSAVTAAAPVDDGVWVGTEKGLWWVTGEDPSNFVPFAKTQARVLSGSIVLASDDLPIAELPGQIAVFATSDGLVACGSTGQLRWLTKIRYTFSGTAATFAFVPRGGTRQLIVVT